MAGREPTPAEFTRDAFDNYMTKKREAIPLAASDLRDLERARTILHYPRGYLTQHEAELLTQLAAAFAAIRAEAKAEGWEDAVKALRSCGLINAADWLAANRPSR